MKTIIDSSILVAVFADGDSCRDKAIELLEKMDYEEMEVPDQVFAEILTVLRKKSFLENCYKFSRFMENANIDITICDPKLFTLARSYFFLFKKLSFTDCYILAVARLSNSHLLTFDQNLQKAWASLNN